MRQLEDLPQGDGERGPPGEGGLGCERMLLDVLPGDIGRGESRTGGDKAVGEGGIGAARLARISDTVFSTTEFAAASDELDSAGAVPEAGLDFKGGAV